jgi:anhydro-N-acetylmuramic acid kinase
MSGTSHDGLDLCLAEYSNQGGQWDYSIIKTQTFEYDNATRLRLQNAYNLTGEELAKLNAWFGKWIAARLNDFKANIDEPIDVIGSHGHTVFHNPQNGYTTQIGSGAHIAAGTGIPCACDFRSGDVARGGQGAPLVPVGDELLFSNFDICLNIGGIANLSFKSNGKRIAFDICPANMALNHLASYFSKPFDYNGDLGRDGIINANLLKKLNNLDYYNIKGAKSLGREWFQQVFIPILEAFDANPADKLRTVYEHVATKIVESINLTSKETILVTGGGAKNKFLTSLMETKSKLQITIPNTELVDFKEALIFGFLAVLYLRQTTSCLADVTGASSNSIGGCLYY